MSENVSRTYTVEFDTAAFKQLSKLQAGDQTRIATAIAGLAHDPRPTGCTKLSGEEAWRIRIGGFRVVYVIDDTIRTVTITRVAKRGEVYTKKGRS